MSDYCVDQNIRELQVSNYISISLQKKNIYVVYKKKIKLQDKLSETGTNFQSIYRLIDLFLFSIIEVPIMRKPL